MADPHEAMLTVGAKNAPEKPKPQGSHADLRSNAKNPDIRDDIGDAFVAICRKHDLGRMDFARFNANVQQVMRSAWGPAGWWGREFPQNSVVQAQVAAEAEKPKKKAAKKK